jgi:hypothetical protein
MQPAAPASCGIGGEYLARSASIALRSACNPQSAVQGTLLAEPGKKVMWNCSVAVELVTPVSRNVKHFCGPTAMILE